MKRKIQEFCTHFYMSVKIPIAWFDTKGSCVKAWPSPEAVPYPANAPHNLNKTPDIYISSSHGLYGILQLPETLGTLFLGPAYSTPVTNEMMHTFLKEHTIPNESREKCVHAILSTPSTTYVHFLNHIAFLTYGILGITINTAEHFQTSPAAITGETESMFLEENIKNKENESYHDSYLWEQELYHVIQSGDKSRLKALLENNTTVPQNEGKMAYTPIRNSKNLFIGTVTKVGMLAAIPGGLDVEQTYQLIDTYTKECEQMSSLNEINALHYRMVLDFCSRIAENRIPEGISREVYHCMCYIRNHTNDTITISDVARQVHRSSSYIIGRFQQELGINIGAYIRRCKLEEAKSLLTYSDKSLSEISNYLCFSSQSYFQNVFKKKYGVTPMQYRKQHHVKFS